MKYLISTKVGDTVTVGDIVGVNEGIGVLVGVGVNVFVEVSTRAIITGVLVVSKAEGVTNGD